MKIKALPLVCGLVAAATHMTASAGFVTLSSSGNTVLANCNPNNQTSSSTCRVTSLPGESGYSQYASRSTPIIINDVTVGTLYEKVWRNTSDSCLYIFGSKVVLNNAVWDDSGTAFVINDLFRRSLPDQSASIAYYIDNATIAAKLGGRTLQGLGEYSGNQPARDNTWADVRVNANGAGSGGAVNSPWILVKTRATSGVAIDPFGVRALNSAATDLTEYYATGYQPNGLPDGGGDD
ncbi:MAG: hypothetical protein JSR59_20400 [Proteobacteria bacterium]|nr:hypothetical protein [Pseudomonadota bacterium]